jgi:two-component system LytT family response regulator
MKFRAIIADDEPLARKKLRNLLSEIDWIEVVEETADGPSTVRAVDEHLPDLLFLDIRMPGATGLEVLEQITHQPHVIFTTAYDKYAVTAFELQALDYLLKPFGPERFEQALERARETLTRRVAGELSPVERMRDALAPDAPVKRLFVRERGKIVPIAVDGIERLEACGDYVSIHIGGRKYLVYVRMKDFETFLDARRFIRIHRSHIVNLEHVSSLTPYDGARLEVSLRDGTKVIASRSGSKTLKQLVI